MNHCLSRAVFRWGTGKKKKKFKKMGGCCVAETLDHGSWSFVELQQINPPFSLCSEPELGLKSVWLFVFIALTNLFI